MVLLQTIGILVISKFNTWFCIMARHSKYMWQGEDIYPGYNIDIIGHMNFMEI